MLVLTKGLSRYKVVLAKAMLLLSLWTVGYGICFAITYGLHALLFFFHRCCKTMQVLLCALAGQCCLLVYSMRCCKYPDYKEAALSMCVKAMKTEWIYYPICGNKTRTMIREDTELRNFPLYCPKCKKKTIISVQDMKVTLAEHK